jgi:hypothetical protein
MTIYDSIPGNAGIGLGSGSFSAYYSAPVIRNQTNSEFLLCARATGHVMQDNLLRRNHEETYSIQGLRETDRYSVRGYCEGDRHIPIS